MVHRDIKPANIILVPQTSGEQAKVLDFGIAKLKEVRATETSSPMSTGSGVIVGTPAYMSPEQAKGMKGEQLDGRSDIYSLGIVMYQMLTGDLPFKADTTMQILMAHLHAQPRPIQEARAQIPGEIASLVMHCLEKEPAMRPATCKEFIERIELRESSRSHDLRSAPKVDASGIRQIGILTNAPNPKISLWQFESSNTRPKLNTVERQSGSEPRRMQSSALRWVGGTGVLVALGIGGFLYLHSRSQPVSLLRSTSQANPGDESQKESSGVRLPSSAPQNIPQLQTLRRRPDPTTLLIARVFIPRTLQTIAWKAIPRIKLLRNGKAWFLPRRR